MKITQGKREKEGGREAKVHGKGRWERKEEETEEEEEEVKEEGEKGSDNTDYIQIN